MKAGIWQHHMFCGQQIVTILQHRWMIFIEDTHPIHASSPPCFFFSLFQLLKLLLNRWRLVGRLSYPSVLFFKNTFYFVYNLICIEHE